MTPIASTVTDASPPRYAAGAVIGKYVLEAPLGEGGMGTVWRARNVLLGSSVALKLLQPQLRTQDAVDRLLREARIEATLRHPGIVRVFDFEQTEHGDFFIVMELLEGQTLAGLLEQRGKIEAAEAVRLLLPVVDALCAAHAGGVVHRDLKPANIVLARVGQHVRPKLVDFGIAKVALPEADFTQTGGAMLLGSPAYMAPEQASGLEEVDHRVDVWGICLVLYEAISGRAAFDGPSDDAVLRAVVEDEVAPFEEASIELAELWPIVARGLAKAPALRFDSMLELGTVLAHWLLAHGTTDDRSEGDVVARSWLRAHALSDRMYGPKRALGLEGRPSLLWDMQPVATSATAALSTTEVGCYEPARRPRGRGAALVGRAAIVALLVFANASVGNRETKSRSHQEPVAGIRSANHAAGVDTGLPRRPLSAAVLAR
jgi:serine/threonine protein kinase